MYKYKKWIINIFKSTYNFHKKHLWKFIFAYLAITGLIIAIIGRTAFQSVPVILAGGITMATSLIIIYGFFIVDQIKPIKKKKNASDYHVVQSNHQVEDITKDHRFYKNIVNLKAKVNLEKIKLIICDLDGTLLNHNGFMSYTTTKLLKEFMAKKPDIIFIPATGRDYFTTRKAILNNLNLEYAICNNGSVLTMWNAFKPIAEAPIRSVYVQNLFDYTLSNNIHAIVYTDAGEVLIHNRCPAKTTWFASWISQYQLSRKPISEATTIYQCGVWVPRYIVSDFVKHIQENYALEMYHYPHHDFIYYELTGNNVNKWLMIKNFCAQKSIKPEEIITIGNGNNDIKMITEAGVGVAVANAEQSLLDCCDIIINNNYKDGVARFLNFLL